MKYIHILTAAAVLAALGAATAPAQDADFVDAFKKLLDENMSKMGAEKIKDRKDSQQKVQQVCFQAGAPGREADRKAVCTILAEALGGDMAPPARVWLIKQCEYIGRDECVDAVAKSLSDKDIHISDAARRALANIPVKAANDKLLAKLAKTKDRSRVGLLNALGYRGDPASVGAIAKQLGDKDNAVAAAAANALGRIANADAAKALKGALGKASGNLKIDVADAYLRCADKMLAAGKKAEASAIYTECSADSMPKVIRLAATQGKLKAAK